MASIQRRSTKTGVSYYVVYNFNHQQIWKLAGYRKIDADRLKAKIENDIYKGTHRELPDIGLQDFAEKWLMFKRADVRPRTLSGYEGHLRHQIVPYFGNRPLKTISSEQIEHFKAFLLVEKHISPATTGKYLLTLKMLLKTAVVWGYVGMNPAEYVKRPLCRKTEIEYLTADEIKRLITSTPHEYQAIIATAAFTGMRQGELLALQWDDIDLANKRIQIRRTVQQGKTFDPKSEASRRSIEIPNHLCKILEAHEFQQVVAGSDNCLVFPNKNGKYLDPDILYRRIFKSALKIAGLRTSINFHSLRHSYASILIDQGANIKFVQKQLGHSNIQITLNTYAHLLPDTGSSIMAKFDLSLHLSETPRNPKTISA